MIALDTSVLVRVIVQDDDAQLRVARALLRENACFIGWTALVETGWVLDAIYKLDRDAIAMGIAGLLDMETVTVADEDTLRWAIDRYAAGADWGDVMHLASCDRSVEAFASFDKRLDQRAGAMSRVPVRMLRT